MQNPNEDTEWNDVLRSQGIIPQKKELEVTEQDIVQMVENAVHKKSNGRALSEMNVDELDELEDEEDERVLQEYRRKRIAEMRAAAHAAKFGEVREISADDYVREVNKAGDGIWVVLHLYRQGIPLCALINQFLSQLAVKFPSTKFLKSISTTCIPNYPDKNLPTVFIYHNGDLKGQLIGPMSFGGTRLTCEELEWMLSERGAVTSDLESDPRGQRPEVSDLLMSQLTSQNGRNGHGHDLSSDENDW